MSQEEQAVANILHLFIKKLNKIENLRLQLAQLKSFYPEQGFYFLKNFDKILNLYQASKKNPEVMYNQENYFVNYGQITNERIQDGLILFQNLRSFLEFNCNYSVEDKIIGMSLNDFTRTTSLVGINYEHFIKIIFPLSDYNARKRLMKMKCIYQDNHIFNKLEPMIQNIIGKILVKLMKLVQKTEELCLRLQSTPYFDPVFLFSKIDVDQKGFLCYNNIANFLERFNLGGFTYEQYYQLIFKLQGYNCLQTEDHVRHLQDEISFQQFQNLIYPKFPFFKEQSIQQSMVNRSQFNDYSQLKSKTGISNISNISHAFGNQSQSTINNLLGVSNNQIQQQPITNIEQLPKTIHKPITTEDPHAYKYQVIRAHNSHSPPKYISEAIQMKSAKFTEKDENRVRYAVVDPYALSESAMEKEGIIGVSKHQVREAQLPTGMGNTGQSVKNSFMSQNSEYNNNQSQMNSRMNPVWLVQDQSQQLVHYTDCGDKEKYIDRTFLHFVGKQFVDNIHEKDELNSQLSSLQRKAYGQDINNPNLYQLSAAENNLISYLHPPEMQKNNQCRILRPNVQVQQDQQDKYLSTIKMSEPVQSSILKVDYNPVVNVVDQKYMHRIKNVHENKLGIIPKEKKQFSTFYQQPSVIGYNNLAQNQQFAQQSSQLPNNPQQHQSNLFNKNNSQQQQSNQTVANNLAQSQNVPQNANNSVSPNQQNQASNINQSQRQ